MHSPSKVKKSAYITKESPGVECSSGKKKSSMMITRSKRQKVEKGDHNLLKLTWEEAQGFLLPPPNLTPSRVVIEDYEFEEYEVHSYVFALLICICGLCRLRILFILSFLYDLAVVSSGIQDYFMIFKITCCLYIHRFFFPVGF